MDFVPGAYSQSSLRVRRYLCGNRPLLVRFGAFRCAIRRFWITEITEITEDSSARNLHPELEVQTVTLQQCSDTIPFLTIDKNICKNYVIVICIVQSQRTVDGV